MWTLLLGAAFARPMVAHEAKRTEDGLHWTASVTGAEGPLALASPLPVEPRVSPGVGLLRDAEGRVVGYLDATLDKVLIPSLVLLKDRRNVLGLRTRLWE